MSYLEFVIIAVKVKEDTIVHILKILIKNGIILMIQMLMKLVKHT